MHDKSRALQDFKRSLLVQDLLHQVHTAVFQDIRSGPTGRYGTSRTGQRPKPAGASKTHPLAFHMDGPGAHFSLPQETEKAVRFRGHSLKISGQRRTWFGKWIPKEKKRHPTHSVETQRRQHQRQN
ncbi:parathyroid hormone-like hormone b [Sardina pilchardus]|uniref:parathyroid hormone-like hormone b n=1 Tax=Sardina pilchardus TaxID=27697 RepID=UPI002E1159D4